MNNKKIVVLGGDGFCGWPTALHLSNLGHSVTIIDNLSRRKIDSDLGLESLTPIDSLEERITVWNALTQKHINWFNIDIATEYLELTEVLRDIKPDVIVHFAEQRAAPYSMRNEQTMRYTVDNNARATHNLLCALAMNDIDAHIVHLGTMGVYGYGTAGMAIPEGYAECYLVDPITKEKIHTDIYYPPNPGSLYHTTKVLDTQLFAFYHKNNNLRITDLHQGIVWGINTELTTKHPALINRFDYDGDYGTVLNRWIVQAVIGHPLTVHGTGGQTRAFIHIQNTVQCIRLAVDNPPNKEDEKVRVWNQTTEQLRIIDIAEMIQKITGCDIRLYKNPRLEASENSLTACASNIHDLGLYPITLNERSLLDIIDLANRYSSRINRGKIICTSTWRNDMMIDYEGIPYEQE